MKYSGYTFHEIETERRNHAHDYVREMPKEEIELYCGVITVSGDGLPHEVINGLMKNVNKEARDV